MSDVERLPQVELPEDIEWPDLERSSPYDYGFLRAMTGHVVEPRPASAQWVEAHKGAHEVCVEAAAMMVRFRMEPLYKGQRGKDWRTPDEVVQEYLDTLDDPTYGYSAMCDVTHYIAMHDTRFFGVEDPTRQWFCSYCDSATSSIGKGAIPKGRFTLYAWKCDKHARSK